MTALDDDENNINVVIAIVLPQRRRDVPDTTGTDMPVDVHSVVPVNVRGLSTLTTIGSPPLPILSSHDPDVSVTIPVQSTVNNSADVDTDESSGIEIVPFTKHVALVSQMILVTSPII